MSEAAALAGARAQAPVYDRRDRYRQARVAASVLHEPEWPVQVTKALSDDHFDYEEGGWEQRDDLFTPGSLGAAARLIDFYALQHSYASFIMDCTSAFYHADEPEEVYAKPAPQLIAKQIEQAVVRLGSVGSNTLPHCSTRSSA